MYSGMKIIWASVLQVHISWWNHQQDFFHQSFSRCDHWHSVNNNCALSVHHVHRNDCFSHIAHKLKEFYLTQSGDKLIIKMYEDNSCFYQFWYMYLIKHSHSWRRDHWRNFIIIPSCQSITSPTIVSWCRSLTDAKEILFCKAAYK